VRHWRTAVRGRATGVMVAAAAGLTVVALPSSASAHTELAGTVPAAGTVSKNPVSELRLEFAAPILPELTAVVVTRGGADVKVDEPVIEGSTVSATVDGAAQPGDYTVAYRTVAADGHPITGSFSFEVAPQPKSAAPARPHRDDDGAASATRRRGAEAATVPDRAERRDEVVTAERPPDTAAAIDVEPVPLGVIGIVGAAAALVALGAGMLRRRSHT
jgi:copper resistance protein C